jgi:hypothetical protein
LRANVNGQVLTVKQNPHRGDGDRRLIKKNFTVKSVNRKCEKYHTVKCVNFRNCRDYKLALNYKSTLLLRRLLLKFKNLKQFHIMGFCLFGQNELLRQNVC